MTPVLGLRLLSGVVCGIAGALTLVTGFTWSVELFSIASRVATEFGYYLVVPAMLSLLPGWRGSFAGRFGALLNVLAIMALVLPSARAWEAAQPLPERFAQVLGGEIRARHRFAEDPREPPFVLSQLVRPAEASPVRYEQREVKTGDGNVTLDIYRPAYVYQSIPGVIVIHGETWPGGVAKELVALNGYLAARDYLVIAMSDPLLAGRNLTGAREDIVSIIAYLKAHASELGLDARHLALMGRSVAGHLPLLVAYTAHDPSIRGVIALYAPTDFAHWYAQTRSEGDDVEARTMLGNYLGEAPEPSLDALDAASPIRHVQDGAPPTLLVHGLRDSVVPPDQSELLATRLEQADVRHVLVRLPWASHACDQHFFGPCGQITTYAVERFLDGVMADRRAHARRQDSTPSQAPWMVFDARTILARLEIG